MSGDGSRPAGLISGIYVLKIEIAERPPGAVPHDKGGGQIIDGLGRQEAGAMANWALASFKNGQF